MFFFGVGRVWAEDAGVSVPMGMNLILEFARSFCKFLLDANKFLLDATSFQRRKRIFVKVRANFYKNSCARSRKMDSLPPLCISLILDHCASDDVAVGCDDAMLRTVQSLRGTCRSLRNLASGVRFAFVRLAHDWQLPLVHWLLPMTFRLFVHNLDSLQNAELFRGIPCVLIVKCPALVDVTALCNADVVEVEQCDALRHGVHALDRVPCLCIRDCALIPTVRRLPSFHLLDKYDLPPFLAADEDDLYSN